MEIMRNQSRGVSLFLNNGDRDKFAAYLHRRAEDLGRSSSDLVGLTGLSYSTIRGYMSHRDSGQPMAFRTLVALIEFGLSTSIPQLVIDLKIDVEDGVDIQAEVHHARTIVRGWLNDEMHMAQILARTIRRGRDGKPTPADKPAPPVVEDLSAAPAPAKPESNGRAPLTLEQMTDLLGRERVEAIVRRAFAEAVDRVI